MTYRPDVILCNFFSTLLLLFSIQISLSTFCKATFKCITISFHLLFIVFLPLPLPPSDSASASERQSFLGFASFLSQLGPHPFLPELLGVVSLRAPLITVIEEMENKDMLGFLWKCRQVRETIGWTTTPMMQYYLAPSLIKCVLNRCSKQIQKLFLSNMVLINRLLTYIV